ncbi:MAG: Acetate kinase [Phycisphaerae bacterium]|nr:Acetate kinase [Phycisphaerae bacterium]
MKVLVSNIGSTSFKYRLFAIDEAGETELASGGVERIGGPGGECPDHGAAIAATMKRLVADGALASPDDLDAVAFKAVMAGDCDPVCRVDDALLARMEYFVPIAPAHNPPYIAAMRMFRATLAGTPLVACFEPGFHASNPPRRRHYACPPEWADRFGVKRYGFHGASHNYIATRLATLMPSAGRIVSCHLGGSSSLCAIRDGQSVATSMGLSPQSGLPQSKRAGDFDAYGLKLMMSQTGRTADDLLAELGSAAGLAGLSGTSGDMRDIRAAIAAGSKRAKLAMDVFVTAIRDYLGAYLVELGGCDALVFTGGIGTHDADLRADVCAGLAFAGIAMDERRNQSAKGEARIDADGASVACWVLPTNEELIVARQTAAFLADDTKERNV